MFYEMFLPIDWKILTSLLVGCLIGAWCTWMAMRPPAGKS